MKLISTKRLKDFALEELGKGSILREILLTEPDELSADVFVARLDVWLRLLGSK